MGDEIGKDRGTEPKADAMGEQPVAEPDREAMPVDAEQPPRLAFPVVGVGASAGGLEAFSEFIGVMRPDSGMAFVFILHLPPDHRSMLVDILSRRTTMPVAQVEDGMSVEPDHVYVIRPGHVLTIEGGVFRLGPVLGGPRAANRPVDDFFKSLAQEQRERAICIIMSGMGSNGSAGAQAIKAVGGLCVAQDPESCNFPSMPRHLIDQGYADNILRPADMPDVLLAYARHPYATGGREADAETTLRRSQHHVREILAILRTRTRQDFSGYKKPTVLRRIQRRMGLARLTKMGDYAKLLRQSPGEVSGLADDLLIHVTGFFRDPAAWEALRQRVIVPLIAGRELDAEVRAWVTACSSGEEAYTLAILLSEEAERTGKRLDIKVFATDMADRTLAMARAGLFPGGIEAEITPERLTRFFERDDGIYRVRQELRECVVFAPQNVLQDPPFSRLDIATCRNLLIYLEPELQQRVLGLLHFGLREGGALFLGTSETVGGADELFEAIDKQSRIFRRVGPTRHGHIDFPLPHALRTAGALRKSDAGGGSSVVEKRHRGKPRLSIAQRTHRTLLEQHTPAAVTVDRDHRILHYHGNTYPYFQQPAGEPSRDLMTLAREGVRGAVRVALHRSAADNTKVTVLDGWLDSGPGHRTRLAVTVSPLAGSGAEKEGGSPDYFVVSFESREEVPTDPPAGPADNGNGVEMAGEIRRIRDELQSTVEELQTSNEELKASHEEVVSMNEELQSSNEELETSREEMQSLNEELTTVNAQLRAKMEELQAASSDLSSLLTSTDIAVLFLDTQFRIRRFTPTLRSLLDLIVSDVGRPLSALARKFDDPGLQTDAETVLDRLVPVEREIAADGGRWFLRRITPYRTADNRIDGVVVAFVDITARRRAEDALRTSEEQFRRAIEDAPIPVIMQAVDGQVLQVSRTWTELTGYNLTELRTADAWLSRAYGPGADQVRGHVHDLFDGNRKALNVEFEIRTRSGEERHWSFSASAPGMLHDGRRFMVGMAVDITDRRHAEEAFRASEERLRTMADAAPALIWQTDESGVTFLNRHYLDFFARPFEAVAGMGWVQFLHPDDAGGYLATYRVAFARQQKFEYECRFLRDDGEYRWLQSIGTPHRGPDGAFLGFIGCSVDVTDRKRTEDQQAFLLKLSDALRPLADPVAIEVQAIRVLGEHLAVARASYCEVEPDEQHVVIHRDYTAVGVPSFAGRVNMSSFGREWAQGFRAGHTMATADVRAVPDAEPAAFEAAGFLACIGVPVRKDGRLTAILIAHSVATRQWTDGEIALVEEVAERTWAAVERARAETAVHESQERLRLALFAAHMGTWSWDVAGDCHVRDENLSRLLGLEPVKATVSLEAFFRHVHPDDVRAVRAAFATSLRDGRPLNTEFRVLWPDGTVRWLQDQGEVFPRMDSPYLVGACIDVTERRQAEAALRDSEDRLRLVVEGARDFAMLLLDDAGRITAWNSGAERLLGFTESEAVGQNSAMIFTPQDTAAGAPEQERAQATAAGSVVDERWYLRKGDGSFWGSGVMTALRNSDGAIRGFVKILRDETGRKHAEEAENAALEAAELANRTKDEFLAMLSHELRTPLSAILLWAKMLSSQSDAKSLDQGLNAIRNSADAQKQLIEDLLDTSRITSGNLRLEMEPTDLAAVVDSAVESVLPTAQAKGVHIVAEITSKVGIVQVHPNRMKQVLWNLLTNAVKFTPSGGNVEVRLRRRDRFVELRVTDTGSGITPDFLPHVFELFRQADSTSTRSHGGLGLGLAICKKLVEQHGGTIAATSKGPDLGSTFTVTLPLPTLKAAAAAKPRNSPAAERKKLAGVHVLLVEDEPETRTALATVVSQAGAVVIPAESAAAAAEIYSNSRVDLIVSDIGMPGEDGYTLIRKLRAINTAKRGPRTPALALTAFVGDEDHRKAIAAGFDRHLGKPVEPTQLLTMLQEMIRGRET